MSLESHALINFLLALATLSASCWLLGFFSHRRQDPVLRAFWWFFVAMTLAFAWLAFSDLLTLAKFPMDLARSPWRATVARLLFAVATWHLWWTLRR